MKVERTEGTGRQSKTGRFFLIVFSGFFLTVFPMLSLIGQTVIDDGKGGEVAARARVMDLVGAFSNDGFRIRDGHWTGMVAGKFPVVLTVNLYQGNQYWFCVAVEKEDSTVQIDVFDEKGEKVEGKYIKDGGRAAVGIDAGFSGQYFVKIHSGSDAAEPCAFVYCYK